MKKILPFLLLFLMSSVLYADKPKLSLEFHYKKPSDTIAFNALKSDTLFCCLFTFGDMITDTSNDYSHPLTLIKHKGTGLVIGTLLGVPSKEMLTLLYNTMLTDEYIADIVPKMLVFKPNR